MLHPDGGTATAWGAKLPLKLQIAQLESIASSEQREKSAQVLRAEKSAPHSEFPRRQKIKQKPDGITISREMKGKTQLPPRHPIIAAGGRRCAELRCCRAEANPPTPPELQDCCREP